MRPAIEVRPDDPRRPEVVALLSIHRQTMDEQAPGVPKTSQHALNVDELCTPNVAFRSAWIEGRLAGIGALQKHGGGASELKSMHTLLAFRGRGVGRAMLLHLVSLARKRGDTRISLETGSQPGFAASRAFYASAGFVECGAFGGYAPDPNSTFMTLQLT